MHAFELLLAFGLAAVLLNYLPGILVRWRCTARLKRQARGKLVLTYDDGPGSSLEPKLIELLQRYDAKATFFLVGKEAEAAPERCRALVEAGHEIGSHGYGHVNAWRALPWTAVTDVRRGFAALDGCGLQAGLYRPPFGKLTVWNWLEVARRRKPIAYWTRVSGDTYAPLPEVEESVRRVSSDGGGGGAVAQLRSAGVGGGRGAVCARGNGGIVGGGEGGGMGGLCGVGVGVARALMLDVTPRLHDPRSTSTIPDHDPRARARIRSPIHDLALAPSR